MPRHNPAASGGTVVLDAPPAAPAASPTPASPTPVSQQPTAGKTGLKKVSFGAIATKKDETKTAYPVFPADAKSQELAARILYRTEIFEALKGALETDKAELKFMVAPYYFKANHKRHEVPSSVSVATAAEFNDVDENGCEVVRKTPGSEALVTFQNRYSMLPDESGLLPVLGERTSEFFRQSFELKIKGDKLPEDKTQELMNRLQELFAEFNATDALEVKEGIKPVEQFHAARHLELTPEQNLTLEQACPIVAMVKTKGRK
jgi:hypothetical protein